MQYTLFAAVFGFVALTCSASQTPIEKVVQLLHDLKAELEGDETAEMQSYSKFACWCEKITKKKGAAIETAKDEIATLTRKILAEKATIAIRTREAAKLTAGIAAEQESIDSRTANNAKEHDERMSEAAELSDALAATEKAMTILHKVWSTGDKGSQFLQANTKEATQSVQAFVSAIPAWAVSSLPLDKVNLLQQAAQGTYAPQSATIQGILSDMYDSFSARLETIYETEGNDQRAYDQFLNQAEINIASMQGELTRTEAEKAAAEALHADLMTQHDDTDAQMKADMEFFDATHKSCSTKSDDWKNRQQLRADELKGVNKALELLTSDDARKLFHGAIQSENLDFFQVGSRHTDRADTAAAAQQNAYAALKAAATRTHSLRLAELAATVGTSAIDNSAEINMVVKAIDGVIADLKAEDASDIKMRDGCKEHQTKYTSETNDLAWDIERNNAKIAELEKQMADEDANIAQLEKDKTQNEDDRKQLRKERDASHDAFKNAVKDDTNAIQQIDQAIAALSQFFSGCKGPALVQEPVFSVDEHTAPKAEFTHKEFHQHQTCEVIIGMLDHIKNNLAIETQNAKRDEAASVEAFDKQTADLKAAFAALEKQVGNARDRNSRRLGAKTEEGQTLDANEGEHLAVTNAWKAAEPDCTWIFGAFEERARRRTAEMEGLSDAKAFLRSFEVPVNPNLLQSKQVRSHQ